MASPPRPAAFDLSASIDALPPRRSSTLAPQDSVFGPPQPTQTGKASHAVGALGAHGRQKSKTDFLDLADSTTRLGTSPELTSRLEQKRVEHERQRSEQKRAFEAQMRALHDQQRSEERELLGAVSAPTTPPHVLDAASAQPAAPGTAGPPRSRSGNDLAQFPDFVRNGPASGPHAAFTHFANNSKSVPGSRRHSGEASKDLEIGSLGLESLGLANEPAQTAAATLNLGKSGQRSPSHKAPPTSEAASVTSFLFDDEDADLHAFGGKYLQMNADDDDKFPILVRRDSFPGMLSASSAALDLASPLTQTPPRAGGFSRGPNAGRAHDWSPFAPSGNATAPTSTANGTPTLDSDRSRAVSQNGAVFSSTSDSRASPVSERGTSPRMTRSANFGIAGTGHRESLATQAQPAPSSSPQQDKRPSFFQPGPSADFAASPFAPHDFGRAPAGAEAGPYQPYGGLDGVFAPYDGSAGHGQSGYGGFNASDIYGQPGNGVRPTAGGPYAGKPRRDPEANRFANLRLEDMVGDMYGLCKDQHGCRFLQKKLEEGDPTHRDMIFAEIYPRFGELMTDAFGNYLSQKLLEYSSDEQRDLLIESIGAELVSISLNMHGTRAVQKMIDFLSTERQVQALIAALNLNVVTLIKDLNGNHVIQKCLNHLPPEQNQWIFNQVATNCIEVATHRHGCCVLQRCIDHASESQRIQLVTEITYNSLTLVQDPFGNYVVQYVLDLNDSRFVEAIVRQFIGNVCALSMQKFSSNVVEKCIRVADANGRRALIAEFLTKPALERLLRDSFGNYCAQTALDYAEPTQRAQLVELIRPILPLIRNTPYGKRIQSKIHREGGDGRRGQGYHHPAALVPGGYFITPGHLASHAPPHMPLVDGRTGTPLFNPQVLHHGPMGGAFAPPPPHAAWPPGVPVSFASPEHQQPGSGYAPFM